MQCTHRTHPHPRSTPPPHTHTRTREAPVAVARLLLRPGFVNVQQQAVVHGVVAGRARCLHSVHSRQIVGAKTRRQCVQLSAARQDTRRGQLHPKPPQSCRSPATNSPWPLWRGSDLRHTPGLQLLLLLQRRGAGAPPPQRHPQRDPLRCPRPRLPQRKTRAEAAAAARSASCRRSTLAAGAAGTAGAAGAAAGSRRRCHHHAGPEAPSLHPRLQPPPAPPHGREWSCGWGGGRRRRRRQALAAPASARGKRHPCQWCGHGPPQSCMQ